MEGKYSESFLLWCRKTESLSDDEWRCGFDELERRITADAGNGRESWPPSYAEFIAYCRPKVKVAHLSFHDPRNPINDPTSNQYVKPEPLGIESDDMKARKNEASKKAIKEMLKGL